MAEPSHAPGERQAAGPLAGRRIAVALTGGIACYKTATLVSRLAQAGGDVRVLMTEAATRFIAPLTLQSLAGRAVLTSIWQVDDQPDSQHVGVARWCELMVIAPATAATIARLAAGLAEDVVSLVACALPRATPVIVAPAMNEQMWDNPVTQRNVATLRQVLGCQIVGPGAGWQACRTAGPGRMAEPEEIFDAVVRTLTARDD